ncbi:GNAT family N-acetyltransferase [Micromonospora sp. DR5-3]|uniref:GNAT family N-acetyltransferase n=1 Tax=unclassified Micromonospora TaxID=2617518 RepID=UPI0011DA01A3|nr:MULTISPECIES: GNAT family protein [unclassified Micromonospora]MCW3817159.1 GNAT family N-acetyltransferase [Micromonospora sp. DR5-3]TYC21896.1 GNAT family N-acetyltransferase [Micromonospora sp. MP36]
MTSIDSLHPVRLPGRRCLLREWDDADLVTLHPLISDPRVVERVLDEAPPSLAEIRAALPAWRRAAQEAPRLSYRLVAVSADRLVGLGTLTVTSPEHRRGEIGYVIHPDHWGRGLGTEIAGLLLRLAFAQVGLHRVEATARPDHVASWRVLEKVGMRREGSSRDHLFVRGAWWDSVRYGVLATDRWPAG